MMIIQTVILLTFLLNGSEIYCNRRGYFSEIVQVSVFPSEANIETELQMYIGTLEILLIKRDDVLQSLITRKVGGVVMGHLAGSFYTGVVSEKQDCNVR